MFVRAKESRRRLRRANRFGAGVCSVAMVLGAAHLVAAQQKETLSRGAHAPTAADEPAVGNPEDYEVLRRLLGVPSPTPEAPSREPEPAEVDVPATTASEPEPEPAPAPAARKTPAPAKKVVSRPQPKPAAKKPAAPARKPEPEEAAAPAEAAVPTQAATAPDAAPPGEPRDEMPATGDVLHAADVERYQSLLAPSVQWALLRGAAIRVADRKPIPMEEARAAATQRYHDQVTLTPNRQDMRNYVAGIPFPFVNRDDADVAIKLIFNQQSRLIVDDMDARKMGCEIGTIGKNQGFKSERTFQIEHWRRLYYVGRQYHPPLPSIPNNEGIRYRELQYPLIEPFDLKGGGWNYIRYMDAARPDDGWLYYPVMRRVRRISTAQRSQGIFGQDMDLDSYTGYAGNPAWMQWRLVGEKTMLTAMHSEHVPVKWQPAPADFAADEPWEPREVYVVEGRSLLPEYAFARRVVYIDKESFLVPYTEIYDDEGKLWKALHQTWGFGTKVRADAGGRSFEEFYLPGYVMIDMQIDHITRCELPLRTAVGEKGWFYNYGAAEGTVEKAFDMVGFLGDSR